MGFYQSANDEAKVPIAELAIEAPAPQPAEPVTAAELVQAKPKRRAKKAELAAA